MAYNIWTCHSNESCDNKVDMPPKMGTFNNVFGGNI